MYIPITRHLCQALVFEFGNTVPVRMNKYDQVDNREEVKQST